MVNWRLTGGELEVDLKFEVPSPAAGWGSNRNVILHIADTEATLWQPPTQDIWRWIVVGQTLAQGDQVLRYDRASSRLDFLTPPPRQAERAALIAGTQTGAWSWFVDKPAYEIIAALMGRPQ